MRASRGPNLLTGTLVALLVCPPPLVAAVIVVDGTCNLVDAINAANTDSATGDCPAGTGADVINLTVDVMLTEVDNTTVGANGLPSITSAVTIEGVGGSLPRVIARATAAPDFRIFDVASTGTLVLEHVSVRNGSSLGLTPQGVGGGLRNVGDLTLTVSTVSGNSAQSKGGGIYNRYPATLALSNSTVLDNYAGRGAGIYNNSQATLTNSTVSNNSAGGGGGGVYTYGSLTLTDSTVSENSANYGGAIFAYGGVLTVTNSTLSGNSVNYLGGGIYTTAYTGYAGQVTLTNSTVSGNSAETAGAIYNSYRGSPATLTLINSTVSGNSAAYVGGIFDSMGYTTLTGSLVANSTGGNCSHPAAVTDGGGNLADDDTCGTISDSLTGVDPALADNGGPTETHALFAGSSAIGAAGACGLATDQRSADRSDGSCDAGSFEFIPCPDLVLSDDTVVGIETVEHCQNTLVGPSFSVAGSGDLTLRVGKSATLGNETSVETNGRLTIEIDPDLQLVPPPP